MEVASLISGLRSPLPRLRPPLARLVFAARGPRRQPRWPLSSTRWAAARLHVRERKPSGRLLASTRLGGPDPFLSGCSRRAGAPEHPFAAMARRPPAAAVRLSGRFGECEARDWGERGAGLASGEGKIGASGVRAGPTLCHPVTRLKHVTESESVPTHLLSRRATAGRYCDGCRAALRLVKAGRQVCDVIPSLHLV